MARQKSISCPACGSTTGVEILDTLQASKAEKAAGRSPGRPGHRCIRCGYEW